MIIDKMGALDPIKNVQKTQKRPETEKVNAGYDSIEISDEARAIAEEMYLNEVSAATPDVRMDKVAEVRQKIQNPGYFSASVISSTTDKLMESLGL